MATQNIRYFLKAISKKLHLLKKNIKLLIYSYFFSEYRNLKSRSDSNNKSYPLTQMQEAFFLSSKANQTSTAYIINQHMHFEGDLDLDRLENSVNTLVKREEILRSTFQEVNGTPTQCVHEPFPYMVHYYDQRTQHPLESEINYKSITDELQKDITDTTKLPLFQIIVFRMSDKSYRLVINFHHLLGDGLTMGLIIYNLCKLYNKKSLPKLHFQYGDYASFEKQNLKPITNKDLDHWQSYFSDYEPISLNCMRKPLAELQSNECSTFRYFIRKSVVNKLRLLRENLNTSFFIIFMAAFLMLISRHSDSSKISIGFSKSIRNALQLVRSLGLYLNTLVFNNEIDHNMTFTSLVRLLEMKRNMLYDHVNEKFTEIIRRLKPKRHKNRNYYFDLLFNYLDFSRGEFINFENLNLKYSDMHYTNTSFLLTVYITEFLNDRFVFGLKYLTEVFDDKTIQILCMQHDYILEQICENPDKKLSDYSLVFPQGIETENIDYFSTLDLSFYQFGHAEELPQVIPNINKKIDKISLQTVPELIWKQYEAHPYRKAVIKGKKSWTYSELMQTACAMAIRLQKNGLNKGDVVAIHGERCLDFMLLYSELGSRGGLY